MTAFTLRIVVALVALAAAPWPRAASARTNERYMECDHAQSPEFGALLAHPASCNLGLAASGYDVQPVPGRRFGRIGLRKMRWHGWGSYEATAHGLACSIYKDGRANMSQCGSVVVHVYDPVFLESAGGMFIYQLARVSHSRRGKSRQFTFWYKPGIDD